MNDRHTLPRTGDRPLQFTGIELASASSHSHDGAANARWHELALYQTDGGHYVVSIGYRTRWQGELDHDDVTTSTTAEGAADDLRTYLPTLHMMGYPPGAQYQERQARIERTIIAGYEHAVSEVLEALEPETID